MVCFIWCFGLPCASVVYNCHLLAPLADVQAQGLLKTAVSTGQSKEARLTRVRYGIMSPFSLLLMLTIVSINCAGMLLYPYYFPVKIVFYGCYQSYPIDQLANAIIFSK